MYPCVKCEAGKVISMKNMGAYFLLIFSTCLFSFANSSWKMIQVANIDKSITQIYFVDDVTGWICQSYPGILQTNDGWNSWKGIKSNVQSVHINRVWFMNKRHGFALGMSVEKNNNHCVILHSNDGGNTWEIAKHFDNNIILNNIYFSDSNNGWAVGYEHKNKEGYLGIIYSTNDGGKKWIEREKKVPNVSLDYIGFANNNDGWIIGNSGLILRTNNAGESWIQQKIAFAPNILGLSIVDENNVWLSGGRGLLYNTSNGGASWEKVSMYGDLQNIFFDKVMFVDSLNGYVSCEKGILLITKDGGRSWQKEVLPTNDALTDIVVTKTKIYVVGLYNRIFIKSRN